MGQRAILCVQVEHFYARVAALRAGEALAGKLVAVTRQGRVLDSSPEAVAAGLRPGMRVLQARRWFPGAAFVPALEEGYPDYARPFLEICAAYTPLVDPETPARVFLDVAGCAALHGEPGEIAGQIARRIPAETGFACRVGGGRNRLVARLAAARRRLVPPGEEEEFLAPLPLTLLEESLDPKMGEWLALRGVSTFGDVRKLPAGALWRRFGVEGEKLARAAAGLDSTPVRAAYPPRIVRAQVECEDQTLTEEGFGHVFTKLSFTVYAQLMERQEAARRFRLEMGFRGGRSDAAALLLPAPISYHEAIHAVLARLLRKLAPAESPAWVGVTASEIGPGEAFQAALFAEMEGEWEQRERERRLNHALGLLALRFGPAAVVPGCSLWASRRPRFIDRVWSGR